ncbi:MAG: hypothetical protein EOO11_02755 [Chitinophagaceae bacterium]|nr:MAG: hypothetical protein EOO11_02755 [Chitinophagaceae bacterium]
MTVPYFKTLPSRQKKITILRTGSFLCEKNAGLFRKMLYQVDGFYVEIWFLRFGKEALWYRSFEGTQQLAPYLKSIDISALLGNLALSSDDYK